MKPRIRFDSSKRLYECSWQARTRARGYGSLPVFAYRSMLNLALATGDLRLSNYIELYEATRK